MKRKKKCRDAGISELFEATPTDPEEKQERNEWVFTGGQNFSWKDEVAYGWSRQSLHSLMNVQMVFTAAL